MSEHPYHGATSRSRCRNILLNHICETATKRVQLYVTPTFQRKMSVRLSSSARFSGLKSGGRRRCLAGGAWFSPVTFDLRCATLWKKKSQHGVFTLRIWNRKQNILRWVRARMRHHQNMLLSVCISVWSQNILQWVIMKIYFCQSTSAVSNNNLSKLWGGRGERHSHIASISHQWIFLTLLNFKANSDE